MIERRPARTSPRRHVGIIAVAALAFLCALVGPARAESDRPEDDDTVSERHDNTNDVEMTVPLGEDIPSPEVGARIVPPIPPADVVAAAYRAAAVAGDPTGSWGVRSRLLGLIPSLSMRIGRDQSWRDVVDPTQRYRDVWDVRATWRIDRLLFDPNEFRISTMNISRRRERRRVAATAIRTYYRWLLAHHAAQADSEHAPRWEMRSGQLAAELDALTDGWFSNALLSRRLR